MKALKRIAKRLLGRNGHELSDMNYGDCCGTGRPFECSIKKPAPLEKMKWLQNDEGNSPTWTQPLTDPPRWVTPDKADHMRSDDPVLGITIGNSAWAVPYWIMKNHHAANLTLGGQHVLMTLCERCSSALACVPVIDDIRYMFRLVGMYNATILLSDYQTDSLWPGPTCVCEHGPLKGTRFERLPLVQCRWSEWTEMFPQAKVPFGLKHWRFGHGSQHQPETKGGDYMAQMLLNVDERLPFYELVLTAQIDGEYRCYPLKTLADAGGVIHDTLNDNPIVGLHRKGTWMALAFRPEHEGQSLRFSAKGDHFVDEQNSSTWTIFGKAISGPLEGAQLPFVVSMIEQFQAWAGFYPTTSIYGFEEPAKV